MGGAFRPVASDDIMGALYRQDDGVVVSSAQDIGAVIVAAGASRRMGTSKPLLKLGGERIIERVVRVFRAGGVPEPLVVTASRARRLDALLDELGVARVQNPKPERGMFSSVRVGVKGLTDGLSAFFVHPVDMPLVAPETLRALRQAFDDDVPVVHPSYGGRRGHPPLLSASLIPAVVEFDRPGGLRALLADYDEEARHVECDDPGVRFDIDTPADYRRAREIVARMAAGNVSRSDAFKSNDS